MDECIICLYPLIEDIKKLECCGKSIHKKCLYKWVESNLKNKKNIKNCFHCKQENQLIKKLSKYNEHIIDINIINTNRRVLIINNVFIISIVFIIFIIVLILSFY